MSQFEVADRVCYRPKGFTDDCTRWEFGRVIRNGANSIVFVVFDTDKHAKAVYERDLWPEYEERTP